MSDVPPRPRRKLSSVSGAFVAVKPEAIALAVTELEEQVGHHEDRLGRHSQRIEKLEETHMRLHERLIELQTYMSAGFADVNQRNAVEVAKTRTVVAVFAFVMPVLMFVLNKLL